MGVTWSALPFTRLTLSALLKLDTKEPRMEVGDELGGTVVILARDDWDQGSNGDKRSDS